MSRRILLIFSFLIFNLCSAKDIQLYLFLGGDSASDHIKEINNDEVDGVQIIYSWKRLEQKENVYDFSAIENDLQILEKYNKELFIQLQDKSFDIENIPIPNYLISNKYDGGIVKQVDFAGEGEPLGSGWVTKQWNSNVKFRYHKLIKKLAENFDGRIVGINLPETSIDIDEKFLDNKFCRTYVNTVVDNMLFLREQFKQSKVVQYVNFLPCEWSNKYGFMEEVFDTAIKNNIGLGNPDTVPYKKGQMSNSYPFFEKNKLDLSTIAIGIQEPDYTYINPETSKKFTIKELYDFDKNFIGADIIFWNIQQPQFDSVLKFFESKSKK